MSKRVFVLCGLLMSIMLYLSCTKVPTTVTRTAIPNGKTATLTQTITSITPGTAELAAIELMKVQAAVVAFMANNKGIVPQDTASLVYDAYIVGSLHGVYAIDSKGIVTQLAYYP